MSMEHEMTFMVSISGMLITYWVFHRKDHNTIKQTTKPETNYHACSLVSHIWLAFSLEHDNIPEIFLP